MGCADPDRRTGAPRAPDGAFATQLFLDADVADQHVQPSVGLDGPHRPPLTPRGAVYLDAQVLFQGIPVRRS